MRNLEERVRKVRRDMQDEGKSESEIRATLSELRRRDAAESVQSIQIPVSTAPRKAWDGLLESKAGKVLVQAKLDAKAQEQARIGAADRIRQLKALAHDVFVVMPHTAEPVDGWLPRVRFDLYTRSKDTCRKLGQVGGYEYDRALVSLRYALTGSKAYREAVETLGL